MNPFQVVKDFERAIGAYTGAPHVVTTTSCTMALLLACAYHRHLALSMPDRFVPGPISVPKSTYVSVPMSVKHAGYDVVFRDERWLGYYRLHPLPVYDSARWFSGSMYDEFLPDGFVCVSFHWKKTLGIQQGGAILHNGGPYADEWLRRARFDGRAEGVAPKDDDISILGWHCYMSPEVAAEGLMRLSFLPKQNAKLPNDEYPDLSRMRLFR